MRKIRKVTYALAICCSSLLVSCGTGEENAANELQEETKPNPGSQPEARMTNPTTPGHQAQEGEDISLRETDPGIGGYEMMPSQSIVENITSAPTLTTLASVLRKAELVRNLSGTGPYTVFAPTNEAFEALPGGTIEDLMKPENRQRLVDILNNHIVAGRLTAEQLQQGAMLKTVGGNQLRVEKQGEKVMVNGAEVVEPNNRSQNGVIHVVSKVLTPQEK